MEEWIRPVGHGLMISSLAATASDHETVQQNSPGLQPISAKIRRELPKKATRGAKKLVGRKSRRAHAYGQAKPLTRAGFEPFCVAAGRQYLSESPMFPFRKTAARTSLRRGSNPARSTCVKMLNRYRAEIFALPFCAFCAFLRLFLSLPYLSAFGL